MEQLSVYGLLRTHTIKRVIANPLDIERYQVEFYNLAKSIKGANRSTGGTSATIGRYIRYARLDTRLCVVDPENSAFADYHESRDRSVCYLGILKIASSSGTLNSTFSKVTWPTWLPLTNCATPNGTMRLSTALKSEKRSSIFIF